METGQDFKKKTQPPGSLTFPPEVRNPCHWGLLRSSQPWTPSRGCGSWQPVRKLGLLSSCPQEGTLSCVGSPSLHWIRMRQKRRGPPRNNFHFLNQASGFGHQHTFLPTPKPLLKLYLEIPPSFSYYGINMLFFMASELIGTPLPSSPKKCLLPS